MKTKRLFLVSAVVGILTLACKETDKMCRKLSRLP